jgi:hypothetical protein
MGVVSAVPMLPKREAKDGQWPDMASSHPEEFYAMRMHQYYTDAKACFRHEAAYIKFAALHAKKTYLVIREHQMPIAVFQSIGSKPTVSPPPEDRWEVIDAPGKELQVSFDTEEESTAFTAAKTLYEVRGRGEDMRRLKEDGGPLKEVEFVSHDKQLSTFVKADVFLADDQVELLVMKYLTLFPHDTSLSIYPKERITSSANELAQCTVKQKFHPGMTKEDRVSQAYRFASMIMLKLSTDVGSITYATVIGTDVRISATDVEHLVGAVKYIKELSAENTFAKFVQWVKPDVHERAWMRGSDSAPITQTDTVTITEQEDAVYDKDTEEILVMRARRILTESQFSILAKKVGVKILKILRGRVAYATIPKEKYPGGPIYMGVEGEGKILYIDRLSDALNSEATEDTPAAEQSKDD